MIFPLDTTFRQGAFVVLLVLSTPVHFWGQEVPGGEVAEDTSTEVPQLFVEREAHDLIILNTSEGPKTFAIHPLRFAGGRPPTNPDPNQSLKVELLDYPGRQFAVAWRSIQRYRPFPELLLEEAQRHLAEKKFDLVFQSLLRLQEEYPEFSGARPLYEELLVQNALERYQAGAVAEALGMLEEAHRQNPDRPGIKNSIRNVAQRVVQNEVTQENWDAVKSLVERLETEYGDAMSEFAEDWRRQLTQRAQTQLRQGEEHFQRDELREALAAVERALLIDAEVPGGKRRLMELSRRYPRIRIASLALGAGQPPHDTLTWSGRRNKRLLYRDVCEIIGYGPEGGEYTAPFGTFVRQINGMEISILMRDRLTPVTGYDLSRQLLGPAVAQDRRLGQLTRLVDRISVTGVRQLDMQLKMPHVRPEALLAMVPTKGDFVPDAPPQNGAYRLLTANDTEQVFLRIDASSERSASRPKEIQLLRFETTQQALAALRSGSVQVVDHIDPATAGRLLAERPESWVIDHYPAPVLHCLVPDLSHPYLKNRDFRRGLLYGINRQEILHSRLLGGKSLDGCRIVSAPLPNGVSPDDPVAYGYDLSISPRAYEPQLSIALQAVAKTQLQKEAQEQDQTLPEIQPLVLGHPDSEIARQVCQTLVQYWKHVGQPCELKIVDPEATDPVSAGVDLLYVEVQVAEPLVDVPAIFHRYTPLEHQPHYFHQAVRNLEQAGSWQEVRQHMRSLHRLAHNELLVIPLFQIRNHFVYRRSVGEIGYQPMSLFQQVERWDVTPPLELAGN